MENSLILQQHQRLEECQRRMVSLLRSIWMGTSDFPLLDEEADSRVNHWIQILGVDFFEKYDKYISYILKRAYQFRYHSHRGPVHADEFYRMFVKVVHERQIWSFRSKEWIDELDAIEIVLNSRADLGEQYRQAVDVAINQVINPELRDQVKDQCRAVIYGWEE